MCFNEAYLYGSSGVRELVDRGLLAIAQKNYEEACTSFQRASALDPSNIMVNAMFPANDSSELFPDLDPKQLGGVHVLRRTHQGGNLLVGGGDRLQPGEHSPRVNHPEFVLLVRSAVLEEGYNEEVCAVAANLQV